MEKGDIVTLKNGGEKMVIVNTKIIHQIPFKKDKNNKLIETKWVDSCGILNNRIFSENELMYS